LSEFELTTGGIGGRGVKLPLGRVSLGDMRIWIILRRVLFLVRGRKLGRRLLLRLVLRRRVCGLRGYRHIRNNLKLKGGGEDNFIWKLLELSR
jgi:hypothetical protein